MSLLDFKVKCSSYTRQSSNTPCRVAGDGQLGAGADRDADVVLKATVVELLLLLAGLHGVEAGEDVGRVDGVTAAAV